VQRIHNFAWIDAGGSPGTAWIQVSWSSAKTISSITIDTTHSTIAKACSWAGRTLAGGTLQYLSGSSWITIGIISGKTNHWSYSFSPATTTALRLYGVYSVGGPGSNPMICEWQIMGF
jgi:hypothetical protein